MAPDGAGRRANDASTNDGHIVPRKSASCSIQSKPATFHLLMTTAEHTHNDLVTKDEVADFKVIVTDALLKLTQTGLAANARMDRFEARMDRLEDQLHEIRDILQDLLESNRNLIETNRRAIGFASSDD